MLNFFVYLFIFVLFSNFLTFCRRTSLCLWMGLPDNLTFTKKSFFWNQGLDVAINPFKSLANCINIQSLAFHFNCHFLLIRIAIQFNFLLRFTKGLPLLLIFVQNLNWIPTKLNKVLQQFFLPLQLSMEETNM